MAVSAADAEARIATLRAGYAAFNRRDVDGALAMLAPDVAWPDMLAGCVLHGTDAVRAYWTRQFALLESRVEPVSFAVAGDRILIDVDQRVRRVDDDAVERRRVGHLYTFRGTQAVRMEVFADLSEARRALAGDESAA